MNAMCSSLSSSLVLCHPSDDCVIFRNPIATRKGTLPRSKLGSLLKPGRQQSMIYPAHHTSQGNWTVFTGILNNRYLGDKRGHPLLEIARGHARQVPDICVTKSVLSMASTCASFILSGPGAPFLAFRSILVALDSVTTSIRSSLRGYALAGVRLSYSEGDSNKLFQIGNSWSNGRLLDSLPHVPRMTSLAVSNWRSLQSPWSLAYLSRLACLLLIFLPSFFLVWASSCPLRLLPFWLAVCGP